MSQGLLCPNLTQKVQREVSQMSNRNFSRVMLLGGLSVNLNHLKIRAIFQLLTRRAFRNVLTDFNTHWLHSEI